MAYFLKKDSSSPTRGLCLKIYFSWRDPQTKTPRNRQIRKIGYVNDLIAAGDPDPIATAQEEVRLLNEQWKQEKNEKKANLIGDYSPVKHIGYYPLKNIVSKLDVKKSLDKMQLGHSFHFNMFDTLMNLVWARLIKPASKKRTYERIFPTLFDAPDVSYDQVLSCLDFTGQNYEKYIEAFTAAVEETYILDTSSTLFDCTNFYFEIDEEDELRKKGPSKEKRTDPIIGMGLLLDKNAIPIGMKLYPGNQSEIPVLREIIKSVKEQNNIHGRTIQVADKGLNCAQNIIEAVGSGDGYIFSKSVRKASEDLRAWIFNEEPLIEVRDKDGCKYSYKDRKIRVKYAYKDPNGRPVELEVDERQMVTFNKKLQKKQRNEIMKLVNKARDLCKSQAKRQEFGECSKFVDFESVDSDTGEVGTHKIISRISEEKIQKALDCAGYNMLITSETEIPPKEVYEKYHELWRIEETFRCMKSEIDARPVYLQKQERIYGHFLVCYIGVLLERLFQFKTLKNQFGSQQIYSFIRGLKILPEGAGRYTNLSVNSKVIEYVAKEFAIPIRNYNLTTSQLKKVLNRPF